MTRNLLLIKNTYNLVPDRDGDREQIVKPAAHRTNRPSTQIGSLWDPPPHTPARRSTCTTEHRAQEQSPAAYLAA